MKCEWCGEEAKNSLNGPYCCTDHKEIYLLKKENEQLKQLLQDDNGTNKPMLYLCPKAKVLFSEKPPTYCTLSLNENIARKLFGDNSVDEAIEKRYCPVTLQGN